MTHWQRAALVFVATPCLFVAGIYVTDWLERLIGRHWWDPILGGALLVLLWSLFVWEITQ